MVGGVFSTENGLVQSRAKSTENYIHKLLEQLKTFSGFIEDYNSLIASFK